ncbi:MAG: HNH endonuclease signature motif containing protein, partial [Mycobacterium sp.]
CAPTGRIPPPTTPPDERCGERTAMMPRRTRTRTQDRAYRIATERRHNRQARHARQDWREAYSWSADQPAGDGEPPPF